MVGLGNSRRGMKSPPLLVAALVACIIVLGFNYWITSSRSVDLQNRIMELEGRARRAAAERGAVELKKNEFQGELKKQREQIDKIQSLHNIQMENMNKMHRDEKAMLLHNITINEKLVYGLQENLKELQQEYGKLQLDVYMFQKNQTNLQRKFTYDMSQCISQMKELKEQCEERIEEISRKGSDIPQIKEKKDISNTSDKNYQVNIQVPTFGQPKFQHLDVTKQKNELLEKQGSLKLEALEPTPMVNNMAEMDNNGKKGTSDINKEEPKNNDIPSQDHLQIPAKPSRDNKGLPPEPGTEQDPHEQGRNGHLTNEAVDHQNINDAQVEDEEIEREQLLNDDQETSKGDPEIKRVNQDSKGADYNLDVNKAESEREKQVALVNQPNNFNVQNLEDPNLQNQLFKHDEDHQEKL